MIGVRFLSRVFAAVLAAGAVASPSTGEDAVPPPFQAQPLRAQPLQAQPFEAYVDMKTFMEHVLTPAAAVIWRVNGVVIDEKGEHDLSPKSDADWEQTVSGAATLAEATNALMIPQRVRDAEWTFCVKKLADAANKAYLAAEAHDLKSISAISDRLDGICAACHRHYGLE
jgi:hypothetical protein